MNERIKKNVSVNCTLHLPWEKKRLSKQRNQQSFIRVTQKMAISSIRQAKQNWIRRRKKEKYDWRCSTKWSVLDGCVGLFHVSLFELDWHFIWFHFRRYSNKMECSMNCFNWNGIAYDEWIVCFDLVIITRYIESIESNRLVRRWVFVAIIKRNNNVGDVKMWAAMKKNKNANLEIPRIKCMNKLFRSFD